LDIGLAKNSLFPESSGVSRGWDGVLARYKKSYPNHAAMGQLEFSDLEFRFLGLDAAARSWPWHLKARERRHRGSVHAGVAEVSGRLEIIHDHTSAVGGKQ